MYSVVLLKEGVAHKKAFSTNWWPKSWNWKKTISLLQQGASTAAISKGIHSGLAAILIFLAPLFLLYFPSLLPMVTQAADILRGKADNFWQSLNSFRNSKIFYICVLKSSSAIIHSSVGLLSKYSNRLLYYSEVLIFKDQNSFTTSLEYEYKALLNQHILCLNEQTFRVQQIFKPICLTCTNMRCCLFCFVFLKFSLWPQKLFLLPGLVRFLFM